MSTLGTEEAGSGLPQVTGKLLSTKAAEDVIITETHRRWDTYRLRVGETRRWVTPRRLAVILAGQTLVAGGSLGKGTYDAVMDVSPALHLKVMSVQKEN